MGITKAGLRSRRTAWTRPPEVVCGVLAVRFVAGDRRLPVLRLRDAA
jgi:hypothetical protein